MNETASDIVSRVKISEVYTALGGKRLRFGRGPAFWRRGDGQSVSFNDSKGAWYDFVTGGGGGVLDLVSTVQRCSRADALKWLADYTGVPLHDRPVDPAYAKRRAAAEAEARDVLTWRDSLIEALREYRREFIQTYHASKNFLLHHDLEACERAGDMTLDIAWECQFTHPQKIADLDHRIRLLSDAPLPWLVSKYRTRRRAA